MFTTTVIGLSMVIALVCGVVCMSNDAHNYKMHDNAQDEFTAFEGVWQR